MVVDLNRFEPYQEIKSGFLWVVEQVREPQAGPCASCLHAGKTALERLPQGCLSAMLGTRM